MANTSKKSAEEGSQGIVDDSQTWIDFDCLDEEERGYMFDEWWVKLTDQGKENVVNPLRIVHAPKDEAKEGLLVSGIAGVGHAHFSRKPLTRRFCSFTRIPQRLRRYSFRLTKQNKRQDKKPLLSES
jgi:hypothetical protein